MSTEQQRAEILESADALVLRRNTFLRTLAEELAHRQQVPVREMIKEIERAYVDAAETQYGKGYTFWASVQDDGTIKLAQVLKVVEEVKTPQREVARSNLLETDPDVQLGHYVVNTIEPIHPPKFAQSVRLQETHITNLKISR